jgi:hypothetical protein
MTSTTSVMKLVPHLLKLLIILIYQKNAAVTAKLALNNLFQQWEEIHVNYAPVFLLYLVKSLITFHNYYMRLKIQLKLSINAK